MREGLADGIKLDDAANVWTAEYEGIYVRNKYGKVLGVINATPLLVPGSSYVIENFALAGDTLVILAAERLWTLKLAKQIVAPGNPFVEWRGQLPGKAILKIIPVYFQSFGLS